MIHKRLLSPGLSPGKFIPKRSLTARGYKNFARQTVYDDLTIGGKIKRQLYNKTYWTSPKGDKLVGVVRHPNKALQVRELHVGYKGMWPRERQR